MKAAKVLVVLVVLSILLACATAAMAENREGAFNLSPFVGGYFFEGDQNLDDGLAVGLGLGYNLTERISAELGLNYISSETEALDIDVDGYLYRLEGLYHFMPDSKLVPFVAAGLGGITLDSDRSSSDSDFLADYGLGLKYFLNNDLALRADVRHIYVFDDPDNNLLATVGLNFLFGGEQQPAPPEDSDGDGVNNRDDRCPATPRGAPVDRDGCPLDSDKDGVYDHMDRCPDTLRDALVDRNGCPLTFTLNIEFDLDKADIKDEHHGELQKAADFIRTNPSPRILISGHTDDQGEADYNLDLSQRRAQSVRQYLIDVHGVNDGKLVAKGFGEEFPIADNGNRDGRQKNRRVEVTCCTIIFE